MSERQYIAIIKNHPELAAWREEHDAFEKECHAAAEEWKEKAKASWAKAEVLLADLKLLPEGFEKSWNTGCNDTAFYVEKPSELPDELLTKIKDAMKKAMS